MASIAGHVARGVFPLALERTVFGIAPRLRSRAGDEVSADLTTARLLAGVGIGGLVSLPFLMLASMVLQAPFAGPAAIAAGHLAAADALANGQRRRAAIYSFAVLAGFVAWAPLAILFGETLPSGGTLAAALLAPSFAAAPAFARYLSASGAHPARAAAERDARCLDELAPSESVLFLDRKGVLLAATRAGRDCLELGPSSAGMDVGGFLDPADRPLLHAALAHCGAGGAPQEVVLRRCSEGGAGRPLAATLAAAKNGGVSVRLRLAEPPEPAAEMSACSRPLDRSDAVAAADVGSPPVAVCDVREAIAFALARLAAKARGKAVEMTSRADAGIVAACDRQTARCILSLVTECMLTYCREGGVLTVSARPLKGAILVRIGCEADDDPLARRFGEALAATPATAAVSRAGGSLVVEARGESVIASIRLARPPAGMANRNPREDKGAA